MSSASAAGAAERAITVGHERYRRRNKVSWGQIANVVGLAGVAMILAAYWMLQTERLRPENPWYSVLNAAGSGGILFSLCFEFNLSAALVEGMWLLISLYGLLRGLWLRRRDGPTVRL